MTTQTGRQVLKSFQAKETLWMAFETCAAERGCSVDYLVNEALRLYATAHGLPVPSDMGSVGTEPPERPTAPPPAPRASAPSAPPLPPRRVQSAAVPAAPPMGAAPAGTPRLTVIYQGQKVTVAKEQFIIGRGSKSADLSIKDVNISRKHAAVIFHNGAYYIKDLGSTNGVEFKERPIDSKRIDEGDVFTICGHEIHFTYSV